LGYTKENVHGLPSSNSSRACADGAAKSFASLQDNRVLNGILRYTPQSILSTVLKDKFDRFSEILSTLFPRAALSVSPWYLQAVPDEPVSVLLYDRGEFIMHSDPLISFPLF
jgi:hypothetical protein